VEEVENMFIIKELEKFELSDRASLIKFVYMLFYVVKGEMYDASTSEVSTSEQSTSEHISSLTH